MDLTKETIGIIGVIGMLVNTVLGWFLKSYSDKVKARRRADKIGKHTDRLRAMTNVYLAMEKLRDHPMIDRVLLVEVSNEGAAPKPGSVLWGRAIDAKVDPDTGADRNQMMQNYDQFRLDTHYISMVIDLITNSEKILITDEMPDCMLKGFYQQEGVHYSEAYHIFTDLKMESNYIMSVAVMKERAEPIINPKEEFQDRSDLRGFIDSQVHLIRDSFEIYRQ